MLLPGVISGFAGTGIWANTGDGGLASNATLGNPQGLAIDAAGNIYVADSLDQVVRKVSAATNIISTVAGNPAAVALGDGRPATSARLNAPTGVAVDAAGNLYIADCGNNRVRYVDAVSGTITTIAGNGSTSGNLGDGGAATAASLYGPTDVAVDTAGNLYIADSYHGRIRKVDVTGTISTAAGGGTPGAGADGLGNGGPAVDAILNAPSGVTFDDAGNLYVADSGNNLIRVIRSGIISVVAGNGTPAFSGDGAAAINASLKQPTAVRLDAGGAVYIADSGNSVARRVDAAGTITTIAGIGGQFGSFTNGVAATSTRFNNPGGIAVDASGRIYISDQGNRMVRQVQAWTLPLAFAATAVGSQSAPQVLSLANVGNQPLDLTAVSFTGSFVQQSSGVLDCAAPNTLAPATSCSIGISFAPSTAGALTGSVSINSQTVSLTGMGTGSGTGPVVSPGSLTFSNQAAGVASPAQTVTLRNSAASSLAIDGIWISGTDASDFSVGTTSCQSSISASGNCTVSVIFTPSTTGARSALLTLSESSFTQTIFLSGTAGVSAPSATASVNFGTEPVGTTSSVQSATLSNPNAISLSIGSISLGGPPDFAITGTTCGSILAANASCVVSLTFTPTVTGPRSGVLSFSDRGGNSPQSTALRGTGVLPLPVITPSLSFGSQNVNTTSAAQTVTVSNSSAVALSISSVSITAGSAFFSISANTCGSNLAANGSCSISVLFTPGAAGAVSGTLTLVDSAANSPQAVALTGTGVAVSGGGGSPPPVTAGLLFVPVTPCRVVDTRLTSGPLGGPELANASSRSFPILQGACGVPASAAAYSLNVTVVTEGFLGYLSIWPTGQAQPYVSTLNSWDGRIKANAVIIDAGTNGAVSVYVSDKAHVILDINGYFAPPGDTAAFAFYPATPCRLVDTRQAKGPFGGPSMAAGETRSFAIPTTTCSIPTNAAAYSVNFTVVPHGTFGFLSTWPAGQNQPLVSTLNAFTGQVTANSAIVPAGTGGAISVYVTHASDLVIDIDGYFAPEGSGGMALYSLTPCRALDTRSVGNKQPFSGTLVAGISSSGCGVPTRAEAVVTNATAVPSEHLGFLSLWADGDSQPYVSTLNSFDGSVTSNMAIIPMANGSVDAYASDPTHLVLDVSGYFAP
jgi:sugar lactone lactonase YvrE